MLQRIGDIELPSHAGAGAFDHAAVHRRTGLVYVAHTANDAVDVIELIEPRWRLVERHPLRSATAG